MAKTLTITDVRVNIIRFARDEQNNISYEVDYYWVDANGIIPGINLRVDSQHDIPFASLPADVRNAMTVLGNYAKNRILTLEGIS